MFAYTYNKNNKIYIVKRNCKNILLLKPLHKLNITPKVITKTS